MWRVVVAPRYQSDRDRSVNRRTSDYRRLGLDAYRPSFGRRRSLALAVLAMFAAILRASSLLSNLAAERRPGSLDAEPRVFK
jgi:hypothetical protein